MEGKLNINLFFLGSMEWVKLQQEWEEQGLEGRHGDGGIKCPGLSFATILGVIFHHKCWTSSSLFVRGMGQRLARSVVLFAGESSFPMIT